jgi:hypothetical protein
MYILGNASLLCERSDLWNEIVASLEDHSEQHDTNHIGTKLLLKCSRHQAITEVQWPVDFSEVEQGGCTKLCGEDLPCGHKVKTIIVVSVAQINHFSFISVNLNAILMITVK